MNKVNLLVSIFRHTRNGFIQRRCIKKICQLEGGEAYSKTARVLYKEAYGVDIGYGTYGGIWTAGNLHWEDFTIGNYCSIAANVYIYTGNHPTHYFTTHPMMYNAEMGAKNPVEFAKHLSIGHDVWIGQNAIILPGCHNIGNGAVIGAGSVVTRDVEPYAIVVGNPARTLRKRFSDDIIEKLEASQWWNMELDELQHHTDYLQQLVHAQQ